MVDELRRRYDDRFSHFFTAEQLREFIAATEGRFSGVGLTVTEVSKASGWRPCSPTRRPSRPGSRKAT